MPRMSAPVLLTAAFAALALPAGAQTSPATQPAAPAAAPAPAASPAAPPQGQSAPAPQAQTAPKPYKSIAVTLPAAGNDASFAAFRKQIGDIAAKKDRAALARIVAKDFFWETESGDRADKKKSGIDNLSAALGGFSGEDAGGWETLIAAAAEPTSEPFGDKKSVVCAPANPQFDEQAFEQLIESSGTEIGEWGFPVAQGVEVRSAANASAPAVERLGLSLVRVLPDDDATTGSSQQEAPFVRIVTPAGKTGYVPADAIASLVFDQLCYVKDATGWKITGYVGGE
jgi:hypothetical protein